MKDIRFWIAGSVMLALAGVANAQSGFGSDEVSSGDGTIEDSFDVSGMEPEDQTPSGKFTTAAEVGQILEMTKGNWAAVREYDGRDLVYFTHILSWRCGLKGMKYSINGAALTDYDLPPCHEGTAQPNAITDEDGLPFIYQDLGSVETLRIDLLLDNLTVQSATWKRADILMP